MLHHCWLHETRVRAHWVRLKIQRLVFWICSEITVVVQKEGIQARCPLSDVYLGPDENMCDDRILSATVLGEDAFCHFAQTHEG